MDSCLRNSLDVDTQWYSIVREGRRAEKERSRQKMEAGQGCVTLVTVTAIIICLFFPIFQVYFVFLYEK